MSITINTNLSSMFLQNRLSQTNSKLNQSVERMTTGYRINRAADDAAALYVATGLSTRINSYKVGENAVQTGINMLDIAEGTLSEMSNSLLRIRDIAVQAANDVYTPDARDAMQQEANSQIEEIYRQKEACNFNGKKLLEDEVSHQKQDDFTNLDTETIGGIEYTKGVSKEDGKTYYFVDSAEKLQAINTDNTSRSKNYVLMDDIDLSSIENFTPIGNISTQYKGIFDGNDYTISNLTINSTSNYTGLFGCIFGATIKDLTIDNANVTSTGVCTGALVGCVYSGIIENVAVTNSTVSGASHTGGLAGQFGGTSSTDKIINCHASGNTVSGTDMVGGLVGGSDYSKTPITNCYSTNNTVTGSNNVGGLMGWDYGVPSTNSYAKGNTVSGTWGVGGLVGYDYLGGAKIDSCYACNNTLTGPSNVGGLVGANQKPEQSIFNCYKDITVNVYDKSGTLKESSWFASEESATALNNGGNTWIYVEDEDNPFLKDNPEWEQKGIRIQVGYDNTSNSCIYMDLSLSIGNFSVDFSTAEKAAESITKIDNLLKVFDDKRTEIGAMENRLQSVYESNVLSSENLSEAKSTIMDADMAEESSEYTKQQILQEAAASLLVQANQSPALALQLIYGGV